MVVEAPIAIHENNSVAGLTKAFKRVAVANGALANYKKFDSTPNVGTEFARGIQVKDLLSAPNSDELLRDLAVLISERTVVFFRDQDINIDQQKELVDRLAKLAGRPSNHGLHVHPLTHESREKDEKTLIITSEGRNDYYAVRERTELASQGWHSDVTFEQTPSDYASLKIHTLPQSGGDTLWASGYEVYDRLTPAYRKFLEGLTATHNADFFKDIARIRGFKIKTDRGSPLNQGENLTAVHPVIRTHPVTGWKAVFVNVNFTVKINELSHDESASVLQHLYNLTSQNHDLQVRFTWGKNDLAIWDNRAGIHTATSDYPDDQVRVGDRAISVGEKPFFDPSSSSRREALGIQPIVQLRKFYA